MLMSGQKPTLSDARNAALAEDIKRLNVTIASLEKDRDELRASLRHKACHAGLSSSLHVTQAAELSESIRHVQETAQHEIDELTREKLQSLQTIVALRREIDILSSNQVRSAGCHACID